MVPDTKKKISDRIRGGNNRSSPFCRSDAEPGWGVAAPAPRNRLWNEQPGSPSQPLIEKWPQLLSASICYPLCNKPIDRIEPAIADRVLLEERLMFRIRQFHQRSVWQQARRAVVRLGVDK